MWFFIVLFCLGKAFAQSKGRYYKKQTHPSRYDEFAGPEGAMFLFTEAEGRGRGSSGRLWGPASGLPHRGLGWQVPSEHAGTAGARTRLASPSALKSFLPWVPPPGGPPPPPRRSSSPLPLRGGLPGQHGVFSLSPQPDLVPQLPFPSVTTPRPRTPTTESQPHILSVHLEAPLGCPWRASDSTHQPWTHQPPPMPPHLQQPSWLMATQHLFAPVLKQA